MSIMGGSRYPDAGIRARKTAGGARARRGGYAASPSAAACRKSGPRFLPCAPPIVRRGLRTDAGGDHSLPERHDVLRHGFFREPRVRQLQVSGDSGLHGRVPQFARQRRRSGRKNGRPQSRTAGHAFQTRRKTRMPRFVHQNRQICGVVKNNLHGAAAKKESQKGIPRVRIQRRRPGSYKGRYWGVLETPRTVVARDRGGGRS